MIYMQVVIIWNVINESIIIFGFIHKTFLYEIECVYLQNSWYNQALHSWRAILLVLNIYMLSIEYDDVTQGSMHKQAPIKSMI